MTELIAVSSPSPEAVSPKMRSFTSLLQVASLCVGLVSSVWAQSSTAEAYIASESPIAKANMLANIGPSGSKSQGAKAGVVIASPSNTNPNYLFTCRPFQTFLLYIEIEFYMYQGLATAHWSSRPSSINLSLALIRLWSPRFKISSLLSKFSNKSLTLPVCRIFPIILLLALLTPLVYHRVGLHRRSWRAQVRASDRHIVT